MPEITLVKKCSRCFGWEWHEKFDWRNHWCEPCQIAVRGWAAWEIVFASAAGEEPVTVPNNHWPLRPVERVSA